MAKPTILWLADMPKWAYESIAVNQSKCLPGYKHGCFYMLTHGGPLSWPEDTHSQFRALLEQADIVVAMYLRYIECIPVRYSHKTVLMLTGQRPFEV